MHEGAFTTLMAKPEIIVLIPESTRKARGGSPDSREVDSVAAALPGAVRAKLEASREEVIQKSPQGSVRTGELLPAYRRFQGNMYMSIPDEVWAKRAANVEVVIASALRGLPAILSSYLRSMQPRLVVDLLSLEYRQSVVGYAAELKGIDVRTIDFPGMGRASQPLRGERIARILQSGTA